MSDASARDRASGKRPVFLDRLTTLFREPHVTRVVAISGVSHGIFWSEFSSGLESQVAQQVGLEKIYSEEAHSREGRKILLQNASKIGLFLFNSGPLDQNLELIEQLRAKGARIVTSGFSIGFPNTSSLTLNDMEIGRVLAERVVEDHKGSQPLRAAALVPREALEWIPVVLRNEAWRRRVLQLCPDAKLHRILLDSGVPSNFESERKTTSALEKGRLDAVVTFFGESALGAREAIEVFRKSSRQSKAKTSPRLYGVDLTGDVIAAMSKRGAEEIWATVAGVDVFDYGRAALRTGLSLLAGEPPTAAPPNVLSVTVSELRNRKISSLDDFIVAYGWLRRSRPNSGGSHTPTPEPGEMSLLTFEGIALDVTRFQVSGPGIDSQQLGHASAAILALLLQARGGLVSTGDLEAALNDPSPQSALERVSGRSGPPQTERTNKVSPNLSTAIGKLREVLKPGGLAVLVKPNRGYLLALDQKAVPEAATGTRRGTAEPRPPGRVADVMKSTRKKYRR